MMTPSQNSTDQLESLPVHQKYRRAASMPRLYRFFQQNWLGISVLLIIAGVGCIPYEVRPGGDAEILPINQQRIQVSVKGRVSRVFVEGGDGKLLAAGTVIATIDSPDLENRYLQIKESIGNQQSVILQAQAHLDLLLNTPRPEEVSVAKSKVQVAQQQLVVAEQELQKRMNQAAFSRDRANRFQTLFDEGVVSLQQADNEKRTAEIEQSDIVTQQATVAASRQSLLEAQAGLALVLAGPSAQEVKAAKDSIAAAQANLQRLQQEQRYLGEELERTQIQMPFSGYLVDDKLYDRVGIYLDQGDTFAIAETENRAALKARIHVPEVFVDQLSEEGQVELKLLAFPNQPIYGKIIAIQPTAAPKVTQENRNEITGETVAESNEAMGKTVDVIIELPNKDGLLRPGMTGYAKIEGNTMPMAIAFSRSLVRFFQIEFWSWFP